MNRHGDTIINITSLIHNEVYNKGKIITVAHTQARVNCALKITEDPFESFLREFRRTIYKLEEFVDGVANVRSCKLKLRY